MGIVNLPGDEIMDAVMAGYVHRIAEIVVVILIVRFVVIVEMFD
jgi:hypothetical protein